MTYDHNIDGDNIIADALYILKVLSPGDAVPSANSTHALRVLNNLVKAWRGAGVLTWNTEWITKTLVASSVANQGSLDYRCIRSHTSSSATQPGVGADWTSYWIALATNAGSAWADVTAYTSIGNLSLDQNISKVIAAFIRTTAVDTTMQVKTGEEFFAIGSKSSLSTPLRIWFKRGVTNKAYLEPIPDSATTMVVHMLVARHLSDFDAGSDNPDMVQDVFDALIYGLAIRLAPIYSLSKQDFDILIEVATPIFRAAFGSDVEMDNLVAPRDTRTRI